MQTLITIVMCKIWCNTGTGSCWHILHTLQILPPCDYCLFAHKNIFGVNYLNWKTMSTLLSMPLYTVWASMIIVLLWIIYSVDRKSVWTVLVIILSRWHMCNYSRLWIMLSCIVITIKSYTKLLIWPMYFFIHACPWRALLTSVHIIADVCFTIFKLPAPLPDILQSHCTVAIHVYPLAVNFNWGWETLQP
jgi:hypothetical protein